MARPVCLGEARCGSRTDVDPRALWRRATRAGIGAGVAAGAVTTIVWYLVPALKSKLYELVPAFGVVLVVTWLVSRRTEPPVDAEDMLAAMAGPSNEVGD